MKRPTRNVSDEIKPMTAALRRKMRKQMIADIESGDLHYVIDAAEGGLYRLMMSSGAESSLPDTKGVKCEAKALLKSLSAWARAERRG